MCGTDRDSDIGSEHDCDCRSQFNSESTVEGREGRGREGGREQRDILHCDVLDVAHDGTISLASTYKTIAEHSAVL